MTSNCFQTGALASLCRWWWLVAALYALSLLMGYGLLRAGWNPDYAGRWIGVTAGTLTYALWLLWRGLKDNHRHEEAALLPTFGAGNALTLLRGLAIGLLAGFLFSPRPPDGLVWIPALLYTLAIVADYLDGYLARITRHVTLLGETLDMEFDALGVLIATLLAVEYSQLPGWYLLLGLARYLFVFGMWWLKRQGKPVYDLVPSTNRRIIAGFQMSFTSVMLWPLFSPPATMLAGALFALPFTAGFIRDWLVVSGCIDPASRPYLEAMRTVADVMTGWLPVLLRLAVVIVMIAPGGVFDRMALFSLPGGSIPQPTALAIGIAAAVASAMLTLGVAGRLAALGLLAIACVDILARGLDPANGLVLAGTVAIMLLGTGVFSIWRPEDALLNRRAGEKRGDQPMKVAVK
jgi:CDP-diacylglycerol--glycerol-3-phosphate 3-phosphatidyltransferase